MNGFFLIEISFLSTSFIKGLKVFAACLTPKGVEELKAAHPSPKMVPFLMDVTNDESVENGFKEVVKNLTESGEKDGLWAIVNNAGHIREITLFLTILFDFCRPFSQVFCVVDLLNCVN